MNACFPRHFSVHLYNFLGIATKSLNLKRNQSAAKVNAKLISHNLLHSIVVLLSSVSQPQTPLPPPPPRPPTTPHLACRRWPRSRSGPHRGRRRQGRGKEEQLAQLQAGAAGVPGQKEGGQEKVRTKADAKVNFYIYF